jgi:hypothetical protein
MTTIEQRKVRRERRSSQMKPNSKRRTPRLEVSLVSKALIESVVADLGERAENGERGLLDYEPNLQGYLEAKILELAGKMALTGAPTDMIQGVTLTVHYLVDITANAVAKAHRELWDDFLPFPGQRTVQTIPVETEKQPKPTRDSDRSAEEQVNKEG